MIIKKYLYISLAITLIIFSAYFWYVFNQNQKLKQQVQETTLLKADNAEIKSESDRIKYEITQELENCNATLAQKEGNFGEYEYCQKFTEFVTKLKIQ